jgi:hypothetical protein
MVEYGRKRMVGLKGLGGNMKYIIRPDLDIATEEAKSLVLGQLDMANFTKKVLARKDWDLSKKAIVLEQIRKVLEWEPLQEVLNRVGDLI